MDFDLDISPIVTAIVVLILLFIVWFILVSNKLSRYLMVIEESKSNIDIALAKRFDTISEMLKVAKSYAKHERRVFVELVKLRKGASVDEMNTVMRQQSRALEQIFAVGEAYPQMLSSQQFLNLQDQIDSENEQLAASKRIANSNISIFNQLVVSFPQMMVAGIRRLRALPFLEEDNLDSKRSISGFNYDID